MQTVQSIWDMANRADSISTIITGVLVVIFVAGKIGWDLWQNRKEGKEDDKKQTTHQSPTAVSENDIDSLEILTDTYIEIIKKLRNEVDALKKDVESLLALKEENQKLQAEINNLNKKNQELLEANARQEKKIRALTTRVSKLAKAGKQSSRKGR